MSVSSPHAPLTPTRLQIHDVVRVLRKAGARHVTEEALRADVEAGAPTNADGTINLVHYAAWLVKELARGR